MRSENQFLSNLGICIPGSAPQEGDATLQIPPLVLSSIEPISPLFRLVGSGGTTEQSINCGISVNRNNQAAANNIMVTFSKGLFEVDIFLSARFNWTAAGGTGIHTFVQLLVPGGGAGSPLMGFFAQTGAFTANRKLRVLLSESGWILRFDYGITGVAENLDATVNAQVTRLL